MADQDSSHLSSSQSLYASAPFVPSSKLCSQTYKSASQLFLTRRLQESLNTLAPIVTTPAASDDVQIANGDNTLAPVAFASSNVRIKVWNLYITLLSNIVDLGPEEGKRELGQKEWKAIVAKVRDGSIWEEIVQTGYQGLEGSVDTDVVYNLGTLLLTHSASQTLNQQRLETYLSTYHQPDLDVTAYMENSSSGTRRLTRNGGTDTPKDLAARVKIIELFTLHVLPQNGEWDYAAEFIRFSEVLDEERKEVFLQTLDELKDEKERGNQRAAELQREKEAEIERQIQEAEEKRKAAAEAATEKPQKLSNGHKRTGSEVDYGIDKNHPNAAGKSRPVKGGDKSVQQQQGGDNKKPKSGAATTARRTGFPQPSSSSKSAGEKQKPAASASRRIRIFYNVLRNIFQHIQHSVAGNPTAFIRTVLFTIGFLLALSRQDVRARIQRLTNSSWQKIRGTVGMGMKVSYI